LYFFFFFCFTNNCLFRCFHFFFKYFPQLWSSSYLWTKQKLMFIHQSHKIWLLITNLFLLDGIALGIMLIYLSKYQCIYDVPGKYNSDKYTKTQNMKPEPSQKKTINLISKHMCVIKRKIYDLSNLFQQINENFKIFFFYFICIFSSSFASRKKSKFLTGYWNQCRDIELVSFYKHNHIIKCNIEILKTYEAIEIIGENI
jgi:hypothetical protein